MESLSICFSLPTLCQVNTRTHLFNPLSFIKSDKKNKVSNVTQCFTLPSKTANTPTFFTKEHAQSHIDHLGDPVDLILFIF